MTKTLEIVGNGFSIRNYWKSADVTWGICNTAAILPACDMAWFMDDLPWLTKNSGFDFKNYTLPLMTCKTYDEVPTSIAYPLDDVLQSYGIDWLNNTVAYAIAYAIYSGYSEIHFHGVDYYDPDSVGRDAQRRCTEMWINYAKHQGVVIKINPLSFLFDTNKKHLAELDADVQIEMQKVWEFHERDGNYFYGYQSGLPQLEFDWGYKQDQQDQQEQPK